MQLNRLLFLLALLPACGDNYDAPGPKPVLIEYFLAKFKLDAAKYGKDFSPDDFTFAVVKSLDGGKENLFFHTAARCVDFAHIEINKDVWEHRSDLIRELIIYHELGHCFLHRSHKNGIDSIMTSDVERLNESYKANRTKLVKELFTGN